MEYRQRKTRALMEIKNAYTKLEKGVIGYKGFLGSVSRIMIKYGSKDDVDHSIYYVDVEDRGRYYVKTFTAYGMDLQFVIDIDLVDFRYEEVNSKDEIKQGDLLVECFAYCVADGSVINFDNEH
jgi:hypothetical protein